MRTESICRAAKLAALSVVVGLTATSIRSQAPQGRLDADTGELFAPIVRSYADYAIPQDEDQYGVNTMFQQSHGSFVQNAFPYRPNVELSYHNQLSTTVKSDPGDFDFDQFRGEFFTPFAVDPDRFFTVAASLSDRRYNFSSTSPVPGDEDLHRVAVDLGMGWFTDDDWLLQVNFRPGIYSDLDGSLNRRDWKFFGDIAATWRVDESIFLTFGATYDETFDQVRLYPVFGVAWRFSDAFRLDLDLPKSAEFSWIPSASWIWSIGMRVEGDLFNVRAPGTKQNFDARTQEVEAYLKATLRFDDHFSVWGRGGSTIAGHYDWTMTPTGGGPPAALRGTQDAGAFFEVGVGLSF